ncbi:hypothetical protein QBC45DRAFT_403788 [Copromyces sp. CBS 386.78]|nr:hypothetical protein QBC45DRAFT_403788 [Copromyces sp. CBS 386.78]
MLININLVLIPAGQELTTLMLMPMLMLMMVLLLGPPIIRASSALRSETNASIHPCCRSFWNDIARLFQLHDLFSTECAPLR